MPHFMKNTEIVEARELVEGDFIPGLDNGYVFTDAVEYEHETVIWFHDAEGNECKLTCGPEMPITIREREEEL